MQRRTFLASAAASLALPGAGRTSGLRLAEAARQQVGVTSGYDPGYTRMPYPGGDVPRSTGVCADVVVRAARDGLHLDLEQLLHEDMQRAFQAYPRTWGMAHPDPNIDHRRVLNLETFWRRQGAALWTASAATPGDGFPLPLEPGDELTWLLAGRLPHVGIVVTGGPNPAIVQNIGNGAEQVRLSVMREQRAKGHFRWPVA